jgi:hypothetical protein
MGSSSNNSQGYQTGQSQSQNSRTGGSTFGQSVANQPWLENLYNNGTNLYNSQLGQQQGMVNGAINYQNQQAQGAASANQGMQQGGVYGNLGIGNQLMSSLQQSQNSPSNTQQVYNQMMGQGNSYLGPLKASMEQNQANAQALNSGANAAQAAASGMSGGSRQGTQDALMKTLGNQQLTSAENQMGYDTYDKTLQNRLGIAQQADSNNLSRQQLMSGMLGQQQGAINQGINNTGNVQQYGMGQFNASNQPWQGLQNYQNAIGGPTILNNGSSFNQGQGSQSGSMSGINQSSGKSKG